MKNKHNVLLVLLVFSIILSIISSSAMVKMAIDIHHMNKDLDNLNAEIDRYCENMTDMNIKLQYIEDSIDKYNRRIEIKNKESIPDIGFATADKSKLVTLYGTVTLYEVVFLLNIGDKA
jgi:peptidoglycan hydrolase CwlO-like protein